MTLNSRIARENYFCLIDGNFVSSETGNTAAIMNPATGEKLAEVPDCNAFDVDRAVVAAQKAFREWRQVPGNERARYCHRFADRLRARKDVYAALDALNGGNPIKAMRRDIDHAANQLDYFAGLGIQIKGETIPSDPRTLSFTVLEPFGAVGRITAYNHPLMFASRIGAPLMAGNTIVIKPADQTPLSALEMAFDVRDIFPAGVVNIVTGGGQGAGAPLVKHPAVRRIAFTGSVEVGREIMRSAAEGLKTLSLELGGKNPMIVFPDADLDRAVTAAVTGMNYTSSQGQSCGSTSRLFLHSDIHDLFLERLVAHVKRISLGIPIEETTEMGCLVSQRQFDKVMAYIELGKRDGARLVTGGCRPSNAALQRGFFIEPTIFDQVDHRMKLAQEEIFGPVQSVIAWRTEDEVVEMANAVQYGLTASIWTCDLTRALDLAARMEVGFVWINDSSKHFLGVPFGGYKQSGLGREESLAELVSYTQIKSVNVTLA
jgi:acyl-CoA reductase-like NAD-dependent aldehyde dehydrogenase